MNLCLQVYKCSGNEVFLLITHMTCALQKMPHQCVANPFDFK